MTCKKYEIWLADLNPRFGTEAGKKRPVLIVQNNILNRVHPSIIICPITTNVKKGVSILRTNIKKEESGLKKDSAIMFDQLRAIDKRRLMNKIGELPINFHQKVKQNLRIVMDL